MIPILENYFGIITAWSLIYFLNYRDSSFNTRLFFVMIQHYNSSFKFQIQLYKVHASLIFDYNSSVKDEIQDSKQLFVNVFSRLLKENGELENVQKKFSAEDQPWLFLAKAASVLSKCLFFLVDDLEVS